MKKVLLGLFVTAAYSVSMLAQTVSPDYLDGQIWFKIKNDYTSVSALNEDPHKVPFSSLPFMSSVSAHFQLTKLSRPFAAAVNSPILTRTYLLQFSDASKVQQIIDALQRTGGVEYAERVPLTKTCLTPNDPSYSSQWGLATINAAGAWSYFSTGSMRTVAIVDNAVDIGHQDLSPNVWVNTGEIPGNGIDDDHNGYIDDYNGFDVSTNSPSPLPPNNTFDHGTHVAGIASAATNNAIGIAGIGFSTKIIGVKSSTQSTTITNGYDGVVYAATVHADVINMSWGGSGSSTTAQNVIAWASSQGSILVAAAGNSNVNTMFYPAGYAQVISVAATSSNDAKASFSNFGNWVTISAPGENIFSTLPGNAYGNLSGTSMASPLVAGLCGLMKSLNPYATNTDIKNCLTSSAVNINTQNPSYIGQLGAGRIDANAAMNCLSATLNNPPVTDFVANYTAITAGGSVIFTDLSIYHPTAWTWSFPGGTPSSSSAQVPGPIVYSTAGTYNVVLTTSNAHGSNTNTKTGYIVVSPPSGCGRPNWNFVYPSPGTWTGTQYYSGSSVGQNGWVNGLNSNGEKEKMQYFDVTTSTYTQMTRVWIAFGKGYSATPSKIVPVKVYDNSGAGGAPGTLLATRNLTMGRIMADVTGHYYTEVYFTTPVTIPASRKFYVGIDVTNLSWSADTISVVSNTNGQTVPSAIWQKTSTNAWQQYNTSTAWTLNASMYIFPYLTSNPAQVTFTASATTICAGTTVNFNAAGTTSPNDTLLWYFPTGSPSTSNSMTPTHLFPTAGSNTVILYVVGGGCHDLDSTFQTITVNANPSVGVTTPTPSICVPASATLTASGANTYSWTPSTYLSATTGAVVTSTPASTITYNVLGTAVNGCTANSVITVTVNPNPTVTVNTGPTTICAGASVLFDGSLSTNVSNFTWSFPGGVPTSSTASSPTITYPTAGTYTATLTASNSCASNNSYSAVVTVGCTGIHELSDNQNIHAIYNNGQQVLDVNISSLQNESKMQMRIVNNLGQLIYAEELNTASGSVTAHVDMSTYSKGVYFVNVYGNNTRYTNKFVKD